MFQIKTTFYSTLFQNVRKRINFAASRVKKTKAQWCSGEIIVKKKSDGICVNFFGGMATLKFVLDVFDNLERKYVLSVSIFVPRMLYGPLTQ